MNYLLIIISGLALFFSIRKKYIAEKKIEEKPEIIIPEANYPNVLNQVYGFQDMLTFQGYINEYNILKVANPVMSPLLMELWKVISRELGKVHVVHVGTIGDTRHKQDNPDSLHLIKLPRAIDVRKVYVNNILWADCRNRTGKIILKTIVEKYGGRVHDMEDRYQHLHVEVGKDEGLGLMQGETWFNGTTGIRS